jgi:dTDP-4-amino-4,6-dideoxygalactose transaminase
LKNLATTMSGTTIGIAAKPTSPFQSVRPIIPFSRARDGFRAFLKDVATANEGEVLLPSYVGFSSKEGSGVFDPVEELGLRCSFYRITRNLAIDMDHFHEQISKRRPRVVVLIHYFGFPDQNLLAAVKLAHESGALVVEDEAHALYSDFVGGICGRAGDVAILSFHKMLPVNTGGAIIVNQSSVGVHPKLVRSQVDSRMLIPLQNYDLHEIANIRRRNAIDLMELIEPLRGRVDPLFSSIPTGVVPQSLPVLVNGYSRDKLYFQMNAEGYGIVTLYHTLVGAIRSEEFPDSHWLAQRITNLPVHQDTNREGLVAMVTALLRILR